jgi:hypothetical protein
VVREAIVFAVYALVGREIEAGGAKGISGLVPTATYIELSPYLGSAGAVAVANGIHEERPAVMDGSTPSRRRGGRSRG